MLIKIDVTQNDIKKGLKHRAAYCPIALAAKRVTGRICSVTPFEINIYNKEVTQFIYDHADYLESQDIELPLEARSFVELFDTDGEVVPFSFELEVKEN